MLLDDFISYGINKVYLSNYKLQKAAELEDNHSIPIHIKDSGGAVPWELSPTVLSEPARQEKEQ